MADEGNEDHVVAFGMVPIERTSKRMVEAEALADELRVPSDNPDYLVALENFVGRATVLAIHAVDEVMTRGGGASQGAVCAALDAQLELMSAPRSPILAYDTNLVKRVIMMGNHLRGNWAEVTDQMKMDLQQRSAQLVYKSFADMVVPQLPGILFHQMTPAGLAFVKEVTKDVRPNSTIASLADRAWLSDLIVDEFCVAATVLANNTVRKPTERITTIGNAPSQTFQQYIERGASLPRVPSTSQTLITGDDTVILVPYRASVHWFLMVCDTRNRMAFVYDSMRPGPEEYKSAYGRVAELAGMMIDAWYERSGVSVWSKNPWRFTVDSEAAQQDNTFDCGLYTCLFALCAALKMQAPKKTLTVLETTRMRRRLVALASNQAYFTFEAAPIL